MNSRAPSGVDGTSIGVSTSTKPCASIAVRIAELTADADAQVALHALAADVEVAVLEAGVLVDRVGALVDRERRRLGDVEHLDHAVLDLDPAGRQLVVDVLGGAGGDDAGDAHDVLGAHVDGVVDHALGDAGVVADVDEREVPAVLAAGGDPPGEGDGAGRCGRGGARRTGGCALRCWS